MKLIDADKLKDIISDTWILDRIDEQPTVDAVPVIRCKDCKHRPELADPEAERFGYNVRESDGVCPCTNADDRYYSWMPEDDWFCGDGERKDG